MESIRVLNGQGERVAIVVERSEESMLSPVAGEHVYCLTCGSMPEPVNTSAKLGILDVGAHSLRGWLLERNHNATDSDYVLLCGECEGEAIC